MADYNAAVGAVVTGTECVSRIGVNKVLFGFVSDIDSITEANGIISSIVMKATKVAYDFGAEYTEVDANAVKAEGSTRYEARIPSIRFNSNDGTTSFELAKWMNRCGIFAIIRGVNGVRKVYGIENPDGQLTYSSKKGKFVEHYDGFGTPNDTENGARNEISYLAEHDYVPLALDSAFDLSTIV